MNHLDTIAIVNLSAHIPAREFGLMVQANQRQLTEQVSPARRILTPTLIAWPGVQPVPDDQPVIYMIDQAEPNSGYGDHDEKKGRAPFGRVIVDVCLKNHCTLLEGTFSVSATLSHEVIEMVGDPSVNLWAHDGHGKLWMYEACDWVENDEGNTIDIGGKKIGVSNFLLPAAFDAKAAEGARLDYLGTLNKPFSMTSGGYGVYEHVVLKDEHTVNAARMVAQWGHGYPAWKRAMKSGAGGRTMRKVAQKSGVLSLEHLMTERA